MTTRSIASIVAAGLSLGGCANSGPVQVGPDTYAVATTGAWSWSSGAALKGDAYQQANAFCAAQGKHAMPIHTQSNDSRMGLDAPFAHAEVEFRCLDQGDRELGRPRFRKSADFVIETREGGAD